MCVFALGMVWYPAASAMQDAPVIAERARSPLDALAFITGTWQGEMNDGEFVEEIWTAPGPGTGDTMMGMFRWLSAEGQPRMYEMLTISHEDDETILRLRHYNSKMIAWEEKDAPVQLRVTESSAGRAVFTNIDTEARLTRIVFHQSEPKQLAIDVEFQEGTRAPLNFQLTRFTERVW